MNPMHITIMIIYFQSLFYDLVCDVVWKKNVCNFLKNFIVKFNYTILNGQNLAIFLIYIFLNFGFQFFFTHNLWKFLFVQTNMDYIFFDEWNLLKLTNDTKLNYHINIMKSKLYVHYYFYSNELISYGFMFRTLVSFILNIS